MQSNKQSLLRLINLAQTGDAGLEALVDFSVLKIHHPDVADNEESKREFFRAHYEGSILEIARTLEDGPHVAIHFRKVMNGKSSININVFRFNEAGKLTEMWLNAQDELPARPDSTTMLNGATEITELDKTEQNRKLTEDIYAAQVNGEGQKLPGFFVDGKMIQHNVAMENDLSGMGAYLGKLAAQGKAEKINSLELLVCQGNFSFTATDAHYGDEHMAFFDIQRWENGMCVEHWDVVAPMPKPEAWKNNWGKYNFFNT